MSAVDYYLSDPLDNVDNSITLLSSMRVTSAGLISLNTLKKFL